MPETTWIDGDVATAAKLNQIEDQIIVTCTAATRPAGVEGRMCYETDRDRLMIYDGTGWKMFGGSKWHTFTPSFAAGLTVGAGVNTGYYRFIPGGMWVVGHWTWGTGSAVSGAVTLTIPNAETIDATGLTGFHKLGELDMHEAGVAVRTGCVIYAASTTVEFRNLAVSSTRIEQGSLSATIPHVWGAGDQMIYNFQVPINS